MAQLSTPLTQLLGIEHPIMLAGMNAVAHADLVAAVTNAGGIGTIGGLLLSPKALKKEIDEAKALFKPGKDKFGVDLAIPQIGNGARKTNHDYTHGQLPQLIDVIIEEKASLFVCAIVNITISFTTCGSGTFSFTPKFLSSSSTS